MGEEQSCWSFPHFKLQAVNRAPCSRVVFRQHKQTPSSRRRARRWVRERFPSQQIRANRIAMGVVVLHDISAIPYSPGMAVCFVFGCQAVSFCHVQLHPSLPRSHSF